MDSGYASGPAINLADIYLRIGLPVESKKYIDFANECYRKEPRESLLPRIYEVMSKYYTVTGNEKLSMNYMDSLLIVKKQYDEQYSAMLLLRIEQKESAKQQQTKEQHIAKQKIRLRLLSLILVLTLLLLGILVYFYRKQQEKNLGLYRQIKEQDALVETLEQIARKYEVLEQSMPALADSDIMVAMARELPGDSQQRALVARFHEYLLKERRYAIPETTVDEIITALATNRSYLFEAVKTVAVKRPTDYVNGLRLEEAKKMLENNLELIVEQIAENCGFNSRATFYRLFRARYQINPAEYRRQAQKQTGGN
jgi:AraC-like DNA-binding protein